MFIALRSPLPALEGKTLPKRLLVAKWGRNEAPSKGIVFFVNETTARELPRNQIAVGFDTPALDFEHNTLPGSEAYKAEKEPRLIAATGAFSVVPNEGLYFTPARWTPEGEQSVLGGHHPDISPALKFNARGEAILAHSVALCRNGSVPELQIFSAGADVDAKIAALSSQPSALNSDESMIKELLCSILGLSTTSTDAEILAAGKAFAQKMQSGAEMGGKMEAMSADLKKAGETIAALAKRLDDGERANVTALAIRDGKVIPLSAANLGLSDFKALVAELPADQVPLEKRTPEGVKAFSASGVMNPSGQAIANEVCSGLGISKETWAKHNKAA